MNSRAKLSFNGVDESIVGRLRDRLRVLYGQRAVACLERVVELIEQCSSSLPRTPRRSWDEKTAVLIVYPDQILCPEQPPLECLRRFSTDFRLDENFTTLHLLPFFPYSSDDGFSVIDYETVEPSLGDWVNIRALGAHFDLVFDLVLNHVSRESRWFRAYQSGDPAFAHYFIEADPSQDLSMVVRPRSSPLLTAFHTDAGKRYLWTTFSADQVDLNYAEPAVLLEMLAVLLFYIRQGARVIRLDAVAYVWKELGTSCINLAKTHTLVKFLRDVVEALPCRVVLLTETNVPERENITYFGRGDEAQLIYQFVLPPLLLDAFINHDASALSAWMRSATAPPDGATYLNFTASHDGIGVRPVEGLLSAARRARLIDAIEARGGQVSTKEEPGGVTSPYELNITYVDALAGEIHEPVTSHARRFLASQAIMLSLQGIPAVYFPSLVGARNDEEKMRRDGRARSINRAKFTRRELEASLCGSQSLQALVYGGYRHLLETRRRQHAFHPDGAQQVWEVHPSVLTFWRHSPDGRTRLLVSANLGSDDVSLDLSDGGTIAQYRDVLTGPSPLSARRLPLEPHQVRWLEVIS